MHGLMNETMEALISGSAVTREHTHTAEDRLHGCRPLWLTPREAESLLVLCAASPVSAGPGEHDLFMKLGDYFRQHHL